jgi:hypothetical protein
MPIKSLLWTTGAVILGMYAYQHFIAPRVK